MRKPVAILASVVLLLLGPPAAADERNVPDPSRCIEYIQKFLEGPSGEDNNPCTEFTQDTIGYAGATTQEVIEEAMAAPCQIKLWGQCIRDAPPKCWLEAWEHPTELGPEPGTFRIKVKIRGRCEDPAGITADTNSFAKSACHSACDQGPYAGDQLFCDGQFLCGAIHWHLGEKVLDGPVCWAVTGRMFFVRGDPPSEERANYHVCA